MATSEAGNKRLIRRISRALSIIDVKQVPSRLDTDDIKVVAGIPISADGILVYTNSQYDDSVGELNGLSSLDRLLISNDPAQPVGTLFPYNPRQAQTEMKIISAQIVVSMSAAGLAAQLGNRIQAQWYLRARSWEKGVGISGWSPTTPLYVGGTVKNGNAVVAGVSNYIISIPGISNADSAQATNWDRIVPHDCDFGVKITNLNNAQSAAATWGPAVLDCTYEINLFAWEAEKGYFSDLP